jgi:hypothetical protein
MEKLAGFKIRICLVSMLALTTVFATQSFASVCPDFIWKDCDAAKVDTSNCSATWSYQSESRNAEDITIMQCQSGKRGSQEDYCRADKRTSKTCSKKSIDTRSVLTSPCENFIWEDCDAAKVDTSNCSATWSYQSESRRTGDITIMRCKSGQRSSQDPYCRADKLTKMTCMQESTESNTDGRPNDFSRTYTR